MGKPRKMPVELGYWAIRGLANPIRYLLEYADDEYEETKYGAEWFSVKFEMGLDFPNLPWLKDGDVKITQSGAIMRYLAEKHGLHGKDIKERAELEMLAAQCMDFHMAYARVVYNNDFEKLKDGLFKDQAVKMEQFETYLGEKKFFGGDQPKFADFHLYEIFKIYTILFPEYVEKFPKATAYMERFEALPKIKAYMASSKFVKSPINGGPAKWNA